jgi:hypothetical protein
MAMTRDDWLSQFEDELKKLRPHLSGKIAYTIALQQYNDKEHPRDLARQYDKRLRPSPAPAAPTKKRST